MEISRPNQQEVKRQDLLSKIDKRLSIGMDLKEQIGSFTLDDSPEKVKKGLTGWFSQVLSDFPPQVQVKYQEYHRFENRIKKLHKKGSEEAFMAAFDLEESAIELLTENPDVQFLANINNAVLDLTSKNKFINGIKDDRNAMKAKITYADWSHVQDIIVHPFSINLMVNEDYMLKMAREPNIYGMHLTGTPISLIRTNRAKGQIDSTLRHEEIHNFLDGVMLGDPRLQHSSIDRNIKRTKESVKRYLKLNQLGAPSAILEGELNLLAKGLDPIGNLDSLHEEILAAAESAVKVDFKSKTAAEITLLSSVLGIDYVPVGPTLEEATYSLKTAGIRALRWAKFLDGEIKQQNDPFVVSKLSKAGEEFERLFMRSINNARDAFLIAKILGEDAEETVHGLLYLLSPSQFHHIRKYLEYKYGRDKISKVKEDSAFIENLDFSKASLEKTTSLIKDNLGLLQLLSKKETYMGDSIFEEARDIGSVEEFREYKVVVEKFVSSTGLKNIPLEMADYGFFLGLGDSIIESGVDSEGYKIYQQLSEEEKKDFYESIIGNLTTLEWETLEDLLNSKEWGNIVECGLGDELLPAMKENFKN